jgi:hypothetical protein
VFDLHTSDVFGDQDHPGQADKILADRRLGGSLDSFLDRSCALDGSQGVY